MPITPPQAFTMNHKEYEVLRVIENKIDEYIESNYYPGLTVTVNLPSATVSDRMVKAITGHYGQMGWVVEDQGRKGDTIVLDFVPEEPLGRGGKGGASSMLRSVAKPPPAPAAAPAPAAVAKAKAPPPAVDPLEEEFGSGFGLGGLSDMGDDFKFD